MKVQIYVAAHKPYQMPQDPTYRPIFVGAAIHGVHHKIINLITSVTTFRQATRTLTS